MCLDEFISKQFTYERGQRKVKVHSIHSAQQFSEERFTKIDMIKSRRSVVFLLNFLPNQHMKPHSHPGRELYLHVLEGRGTFFIDGDEVKVSAGHIIYCNPEQQLGFTNTGDENVSIYAVMSKIGE